MATTSTYAASLSLAEAIDESWERIGKDPAALTARHARSARKSIELMLLAWSNRQLLQWAIDLQTKTVTDGMASFTPAAGTIDLLDVTILRDGSEVPMTRMSREEYHLIPNKSDEGLPNRFYVERTIAPTVYIWPASDNATDIIRYYRMRQIQDTGALGTNPDIPPRFFDAFCADLAARLARKWNPPLVAELTAEARSAFFEAGAEDRERSDFTMTTKQGAYRGRR